MKSTHRLSLRVSEKIQKATSAEREATRKAFEIFGEEGRQRTLNNQSVAAIGNGIIEQPAELPNMDEQKCC